MSKIIQKEKERQEEYLKTRNIYWKRADGINHLNLVTFCEHHKQSLINLKEYMEGLVDDVEALADWIDVAKEDSEKTGEGKCIMIQRGYDLRDRLKEDIQELNKMIERYGN